MNEKDDYLKKIFDAFLSSKIKKDIQLNQKTKRTLIKKNLVPGAHFINKEYIIMS